MNPGGKVTKGKKHKVGVSNTQFKNFSNEFCAKLNVPNILGLGIRLTKAFGEKIDFSEEIEISQSFSFRAPMRKTKALWAVYQLIDTYYFYENLSVCFSHNGSPVSSNLPYFKSNIGQFNLGYSFKNPSYMYQSYPMLGTNLAVNKQILDQDFRVIGKSRFSDQVRKLVRQVHPTAKLVVPSMKTIEIIDPQQFSF